MAVTTSSSATIRGIKYSKGSSFKCYASYQGDAGSEGEGSASALTKGSTYYFYCMASGDSVVSPYAVSDSSGGSPRGWYKENVFPYATYSVKYNANGGSGAPGNQTKTYGSTLKLSTTKPTRTGYTFQGWGTSASDTSVDYAAGANYTSNAAITLYAIWKADTYTIGFNANGGTGAPSSVTKTYGVTLKLPTTVPTRANYEFKGWATSASASTATYSAGSNYTGNANATLYAVWELKYERPTITNLNVARCSKSGEDYVLDDYGTYVRIEFDYKCCQLLGENKVSSITLTCAGIPKTLNPDKTEGHTTWHLGGSLSVDEEYTVTVTVVDTLKSDGSGTTTRDATLRAAIFPIDFKAGGTGITFGAPATKDGLCTEWDLHLTTDTSLFGIDSSGVDLNLATVNSSDNTVFGYGSYSTGIGDANYMGQNVRVTAKDKLYLNAPNGITTADTLHLTKTQDASATADNDVALIIGDRAGQHLSIDTNEIVCKSSGTAEAKIWIGEKLGNVAIGGVTYGQNNVLASTASYMTSDQTVTLSGSITSQAHGVVLGFSYYESGAKNYDWSWFFVPKYQVSKHSGTGVFFAIEYNGMYKYVYVYDTKITGHSSNTGTGTTNGISRNGSKYVLRYVIGV